MMKKIYKLMVQACCAMFLVGCTSSAKREPSDHFDGKKFFNPTLEEQHSPSFSDLFRMMREKRSKWPEQVENKGVAKLNEKLGVNDVAVTFVNHVTFLIQFQGLNILTDPVWSERASPFSWIGPKRVREPGVKIADLPHIDLILISHNHYDHLDVATLKELNQLFAPKVLVPIGDKELLESIGITDVEELDWWDSVDITPDTRITFTPTQHASARGLFDRNKSLWGSYFIQHHNKRVYFGGDGGYSSHFIDTKDRLGSPDIALLGIGSYEPRFFMQAIHMNPAEALVAHKDLGATLSIGMHFGTFQLSKEAIDQPIIDLDIALEKENMTREEFTVLDEGETRIYP